MNTIDKEMIRGLVDRLFEDVPGNVIAPELALEEDLAGIKIYEAPIVGFGAADDPLYETYKDPKAIGPWHMSPREWMPEAQTIISMFFRFTEKIRESNRRQKELPSSAWLHGRVEGQVWLNAFTKALADSLNENGIRVIAPSLDPRWKQVAAGRGIDGYDCITDKTFGSSWSERHAAYVCGLGTFGLSKGLITRKGLAGRFTSILIDSALEPDVREYTGVYDWCTKCGACVRRCPVDAITLENGKDHNICNKLQQYTVKTFAPRYGCGLCQTRVPCEDHAPGLVEK